MRLDFIEIGTADWDTLLQQLGDTKFGFSIEPIKKYLDNLPDKPNVKKLNYAMTDDSSLDEIDVYYVDESLIGDHTGLNGFIKGCNSVGRPHDFHTGYYPDPNFWHRYNDRKNLPSRNLLEEGLVTQLKVRCITFEKLVNDYNIEYVEFIKIDTEGQDSKLVNSILDYSEKNGFELPKKILFETNAHNNPIEVSETCLRLVKLGYRIDHGWNGQKFDERILDCLAVR